MPSKPAASAPKPAPKRAPARKPAPPPVPSAQVAPPATPMRPPPAPAAAGPVAWRAAPPAAAPAQEVWQAAPPPAAAPFDERQYGMFLHLSALAGLVIGFFFVGPLIMWLVKKDQSAFVDRHGCAAVNFHLSLLLYVVVAGILYVIVGLATLGIGFLLGLPVIILGALALSIVEIVFPILGCLAASRGQEYRYPLTIRFLSPSSSRQGASAPA